MFMEYESQVREYLRQIKLLRAEKIEVMSNVSSTSDSFTTMMFKKAAEAKAAKLKLEFAAKEIELKHLLW
ncbi:hypothetical protein DPMN_096250 [Dreissena polymorpha]|uniref:Uncharacterized protein n=1 Tax=Dreissena polymorpha TaxID=45954 RepID=A0A9D4L8D4_DREPO|nr:hypothetical protein DPMN_096250 [Dreissena polymorpha]